MFVDLTLLQEITYGALDAEAKRRVDANIPSILRHCVVAVTKKGQKPQAAWDICRGGLRQTRHLRKAGRGAPSRDTMALTRKGTRATRQHDAEPATRSKERSFQAAMRKVNFDG